MQPKQITLLDIKTIFFKIIRVDVIRIVAYTTHMVFIDQGILQSINILSHQESMIDGNVLVNIGALRSAEDEVLRSYNPKRQQTLDICNPTPLLNALKLISQPRSLHLRSTLCPNHPRHHACCTAAFPSQLTIGLRGSPTAAAANGFPYPILDRLRSVTVS